MFGPIFSVWMGALRPSSLADEQLDVPLMFTTILTNLEA